jgi:HAE1 family hydrophobic/amphiphilic exporter-1
MPVLGSPVYVKDVADVIDGIKETTSISRYNGKIGIGLLLKKQGDANAVDVSKLVREKFKSIEEQNSNSGVNLLLQTIAQTILLQQLIPLFLI